MKWERNIEYWMIALSSKIERDIRVTAMAGDYIVRRAVKDTERISIGVDEYGKRF